MFLIGSRAFPYRDKPNDWDYLATPDELRQFKAWNKSKIVLARPSKFGETIFMERSRPIEFDTSGTGNLLYYLMVKNNWYSIRDGINCANPEVLLALKLSHRYLKNSPHFLKTMADIHTLRNMGIVLPEKLVEWVKIRQKATLDYKHPSLKQNKGEFFSSDGVNYIYDHDSIHESVAIFERPAFELIREDEADVFCSKERFFSLPFDLQIATVVEESMTLALERSQIPGNFKFDPAKSYLTALEKVCTSISSGWWREFAWENYYTAADFAKHDYVGRFKSALGEGKIRPYK